MRCPKCGKQARVGDVFCSKCGTKLVWENEKKEIKKEPVSKRPISIVFIVIMAVSFFFFLVFALIGASVESSFNYLQAISVTFIVFSSIFIIVFFL